MMRGSTETRCELQHGDYKFCIDLAQQSGVNEQWEQLCWGKRHLGVVCYTIVHETTPALTNSVESSDMNLSLCCNNFVFYLACSLH